MQLLVTVRVGPETPPLGKVYIVSEDEWVADDAEGHRIPSPAHPQGYWSSYDEAFSAVLANYGPSW